MLNVTLYSKPGCHLCDEARAIIEGVLEGFTEGVGLVEVDITSDPALQRAYGEEIPVVYVGERRHSQWFVEEDRFRQRVEQAVRV